jgi:hypothetical protein
VPRWVKVVIWIVVFAACAGVGAYVAAHTDPFPPGVDDPGARATPSSTDSSSASPGPSAQRWRIAVRGSSEHAFRVGGTCSSSWSGSARFPVMDDGIVGDPRLALTGGGSCDFPVAQVQAERLDLALIGASEDGQPVLAMRVVGREPPGAEDLGGFATAIVRERFSLAPGTTSAGAGSQLSDGRGGTIQSSVRVTMGCVSGCDG